MKRLAVAIAALLCLAVSAACSDAEAATGDVRIEFYHSRFDVKEVTVRAGEPVTFTLVNNDPIEHEWIVGPSDIHARHRTGTEPYHDEVPTEVTVAPYTTKQTTITFERPGEYLYICHLPGHEQYGMRGTVKVVPG
ncbi:MAG: cupredoxin domain-containing protein [Dehalococcoidia bacterium]